MSPKFCRECGSPFGEKDRFCGSCGNARPVQAEAPSVQEVGEALEERSTPPSQSVSEPLISAYDRAIVIAGLVTAVGCVTLWFIRLPTLLLNHVDIKYDITVILTFLLFAVVGLGVPLFVLQIGRTLMTKTLDRTVAALSLYEERILALSVAAFALGVIRMPSLISSLVNAESDWIWPLRIWNDQPNILEPTWLRIVSTLVSFTFLGGIAAFVGFVITRKVWMAVPYIRPGWKLIVAAVAFWSLGNSDVSSRYDGNIVIGIVTFVIIAIAAVLLLLPGPIGLMTALIFLVTHVTFAVASIVNRVIVAALLNDELGRYMSWTEPLGQSARSLIIAGLCFYVIKRNGGLTPSVEQLRPLATRK